MFSWIRFPRYLCNLWRPLSSEMGHLIVWHKGANIFEEATASIFRADSEGATFQKTIFIFSATKCSQRGNPTVGIPLAAETRTLQHTTVHHNLTAMFFILLMAANTPTPNPTVKIKYSYNIHRYILLPSTSKWTTNTFPVARIPCLEINLHFNLWEYTIQNVQGFLAVWQKNQELPSLPKHNRHPFSAIMCSLFIGQSTQLLYLELDGPV